MKREFLLTIAMIFLIAPALGVFGNNNSNGDIGITSGNSSSATAAVSENGTEYTAKVEMAGRMKEPEDEIRSESISSSEVKFKGTIEAETNCHIIRHKVTQSEEEYKINIKTVKDDLDGEKTCGKVQTGLNYDAEFKAETGFKLEVLHDNQSIETFQTVSDKGDRNQDKTLVQIIMGFLNL